ncbi:10806_t:CDS:10 [Paraglomus occultum]|uniref:10806_t:CDS:1 n=1 Tax=Paraglomus occultum TaxID=144539 RepID=A0A9N9BSX8_9GLOM|nr:10806_t:CDS:10 [Paraglomus occultum]
MDLFRAIKNKITGSTREFVREPFTVSTQHVPASKMTVRSIDCGGLAKDSITEGVFANWAKTSEWSRFVYIYNKRYIEIRDRATFAILYIIDIQLYKRNNQRLSEIVAVTDCVLEGPCLLICTITRDNDYTFLLFDIWGKLVSELNIVFPPDLMPLNSMIISQGVYHCEQDTKWLREQGYNPADRYYLIVCATVGGVAVWRLLPSRDSDDEHCPTYTIAENHHTGLTNGKACTAISISTPTSQERGRTNKDTAAKQYPLIFAGNAHGDVEIFAYYPREPIESILFIPTPSAGAPITHLCFTPASIPTTHFFGTLAVGHCGSKITIPHHAAVNPDAMDIAPTDEDNVAINEEEDSYDVINSDAFEDTKTMTASISNGASKRNLPFVVVYAIGDYNFDEIGNVSVGEDGEDGENGEVTALAAGKMGKDRDEFVVFAAAVQVEVMQDKRIRNKKKLISGRVQGNDLQFRLTDVTNIGAVVLDVDVPSSDSKLFLLTEDHIHYYDRDREMELMTTIDYDTVPYFDEWFEGWVYEPEVINDINVRRSRMQNELMFDKLLQHARVPVELYPPPTSQDLRTLFDSILASPVLGELRRHCLIYYLLKDIENSGKSQKYAARFLIPPQWLCLMDGYWYLDHHQFEEAIRFLSEPEVTVDYPNDILQTLVQNAGPRIAILFLNISHEWFDKEDFHTKEMDILCQIDLCDALMFQRERMPPNKEITGNSLFHQLLDYVFSNPRPKLLNQLLDLPYNAAETEYIRNYCKKENRLATKDFLVMFDLHHGNHAAAIRLHEKMVRDMSIQGVPKHLAKRSKVIGEIKNVLPPIELKVMEDDEELEIVELEGDRNVEEELQLPTPSSPIETPPQTTPRLPNHSPFSPRSETQKGQKTPCSPSTSMTITRESLRKRVPNKHPYPTTSSKSRHSRSATQTPVSTPRRAASSSKIKNAAGTPGVERETNVNTTPINSIASAKSSSSVDRRVTRSMTKAGIQ